MKLTRTKADPGMFPEVFRGLLTGADLYDSSSSEAARVYYIDRDDGYFLKQAEKGTLAHEAGMHAYFCGLGLASKMLAYVSEEKDWMLTVKTEGEDCIAQRYLEDPQRLCETVAAAARFLHAQPVNTEIPGTLEVWKQTAAEGYRTGRFHPRGHSEISERDACYRILQEGVHLLREDTLIHGDLCLPNIILKDWKLSGFIDFDHAGIGDRHFDLYWFIWSLRYNLHTDRYREYFLDAYGRECVSEDVLQVIGAGESFG